MGENSQFTKESSESDIDPIHDIIDYLVRCAHISFKNAHVNETEIRTSEKIQMAHKVFKQSPTEFLGQFGKYLAPYHIGYFEERWSHNEVLRKCISDLKQYHSDASRRKRARNRRYKALQKMQDETDYFSEKQMMLRNPLLYEQLVGQYLTDEEIHARDRVDHDNLNLLSMILETVDRNEMRDKKNKQKHEEEIESMGDGVNETSHKHLKRKQWGDFDCPENQSSLKPEVRKQSVISAPERDLLREEFLQEMYSSFIEGHDTDIDYSNIDNNEQFDDLQLVSQDAEDKYFDSESNEVENLEEHMELVAEYGKNKTDSNVVDDPLDVFMRHIAIRHNNI